MKDFGTSDERTLILQKKWDGHALALHVGTSKTWDECCAQTHRELGGRPKFMSEIQAEDRRDAP